MASRRCVCGCGKRGRHRHHAITQATIRRYVPHGKRQGWLRDGRNLVWMDFDCHLAHHNASRRLPLAVLPDSVFEFAAELMPAGAAYEYLARYYTGLDPRLDALLS